MAWHRQLSSASMVELERQDSGASLDRQSSSTVLLRHQDSSRRLDRLVTLEETTFELCPRAWYREAKEEGGARYCMTTAQPIIHVLHPVILQYT